MAIPTNIKTLLSGEVVEWARIEFKETWDPAASLKTVCAFANDLDNWGGGYIVIGVEEEDGRPVYPLKGVSAEKLDKYQKEIFAKCKLIRPAYMPIIGVETYQNKNFIVIWCPGGETRPYSSPKTMEKNNKERVHYIRKSSNSVEPTDDEEKDLFNLANRVPFDDRVNHKAEMSDLNITLIQNYLKEVKSSLYEKSKTGDFVEVCQDMNIVSTLPEYIKPKNVGLMFFSMEPDKFFPYTQIDVVQFPSGLGGNDIIEKTFKGPIHQQLRDALQYIKNVIITEKVVKHPDRAEADRFFNFPYTQFFGKVQEIKNINLHYEDIVWLIEDFGLNYTEETWQGLLKGEQNKSDLHQYIAKTILSASMGKREKLIILLAHMESLIYETLDISKIPNVSLKPAVKKVSVKDNEGMSVESLGKIYVLAVTYIVFANTDSYTDEIDKRIPFRNNILHNGIVMYSDEDIDVAYELLVDLIEILICVKEQLHE